MLSYARHPSKGETDTVVKRRLRYTVAALSFASGGEGLFLTNLSEDIYYV